MGQSDPRVDPQRAPVRTHALSNTPGVLKLLKAKNNDLVDLGFRHP